MRDVRQILEHDGRNECLARVEVNREMRAGRQMADDEGRLQLDAGCGHIGIVCLYVADWIRKKWRQARGKRNGGRRGENEMVAGEGKMKWWQARGKRNGGRRGENEMVAGEGKTKWQDGAETRESVSDCRRKILIWA